MFPSKRHLTHLYSRLMRRTFASGSLSCPGPLMLASGAKSHTLQSKSLRSHPLQPHSCQGCSGLAPPAVTTVLTSQLAALSSPASVSQVAWQSPPHCPSVRNPFGRGNGTVCLLIPGQLSHSDGFLVLFPVSDIASSKRAAIKQRPPEQRETSHETFVPRFARDRHQLPQLQSYDLRHVYSFS